mmetsp:Transcript_61768/g.113222  ORF Transcript_61768/g.113222 Transcript_61768/m.113222 type:complete len:216 (+) Transcript_61768:4195-4842(+)
MAWQHTSHTVNSSRLYQSAAQGSRQREISFQRTISDRKPRRRLIQSRTSSHSTVSQRQSRKLNPSRNSSRSTASPQGPHQRLTPRLTWIPIHRSTISHQPHRKQLQTRTTNPFRRTILHPLHRLLTETHLPSSMLKSHPSSLVVLLQTENHLPSSMLKSHPSSLVVRLQTESHLPSSSVMQNHRTTVFLASQKATQAAPRKVQATKKRRAMRAHP